MNESQCERLQANWASVVDDVHDAAAKAGRKASEIQIVGVTKYVDADVTYQLCVAGCEALGESRPQVLWQKAEAFESREPIPNLRWHLIGHLQRNKIRRTIALQPFIHSVDSQRLLDALSKEAQSQQIQLDVLLEANISGDDAKTGLTRDSLFAVADLLPLPSIRVHGLMAMSGFGSDVDTARKHFDQTRELRDELQQRTDQALPELSMGMSGDFRQAIAAGATMVRIGSRLFEGI